MTLTKDIHEWLKKEMARVNPKGEPFVIPLGKQAKQARDIEKLLDMKKEIAIQENKTRLQLELLCTRFNKLTEEVAALQKKLDLNPEKVHRRLELD